MAQLIIPEEHIPVLASIADLSDEQFAELKAAIENFPSSLDVPELLKLIAQASPSIDPKKIGGILGVLISVRRLSGSNEDRTEEIVEGLDETLRIKHQDKFSEEERAAIIQRIAILFNVQAFVIWKKAGEVLTDNERNFLSTRIISNIRPVFSSDGNMAIGGAVVMHTLEITYAKDQNRQRFYVALDNNDLKNLADQCHRAQAKLATIQAFLASSDTKIFESQSNA